MGDDPSTKKRFVAHDVATMLGHLLCLPICKAKLAAQLQAQLEDGLAKLALTLQQHAAFVYPPNVTVEALERLEKDSDLPTFMRSSVMALAFSL